MQDQIQKVLNLIQRKYNSDELYPNQKVLSSSQLILLDRDSEKFFEKSFSNLEEKTIPMIIGAVFSDMYEGNMEAFNEAVKTGVIDKKIADRLVLGIKSIPKAKETEKSFYTQFMDWIIRVTLDGYYKEQKLIIENKTGKTKWTQEACENDNQLKLQAWIVWRQTKSNPTIMLNWIDLNINSNKIVNCFKVKFQIKQLMIFERDFIEANLNKLK